MHHGNYSVSVTGDNVVKAIKGFDDACFSPLLKKNLIDAGYKIPTPVQKHAIPIIMAGRDLMASARPGSGKTVAFLLPIINRLIYSSGRPLATPRVLVVTPTDKIALQTYNEVMKFTKDSSIVTIVVNSDGYKDWEPHDMCHILIISSHRFLNQMFPDVAFKNLEVLVLDESESLFDLMDLDDILVANNRKRQTLMLSTSFDDDTQYFAMHFMNNYLFLTLCPPPEVRSGEDSTDTPAIDEDEDWSSDLTPLPRLEDYVAMLQWKNTMDRQMTSLVNNVEQLSTTVLELQKENHQLQQNVGDLQRKNNLLEEKLSAETKDHTTVNSTPDDVGITKESIHELLTSCESFQKDLDEMGERQLKFDDMLSYLFQRK